MNDQEPNYMAEESQQIIAELKSVIVALRDDLTRVKVQTGELVAAREQIAQIDRALRGHDGQRGLMERFSLLELSMETLIKTQIPALLEVIKTNTKTDIDLHTSKSQLEYERLKTDIERLRTDYQVYVTQVGKDQVREAREQTKFGGRDWFRDNASGLVIAVVTALVMLTLSGVVQQIVSRIQP